MNESGMSELGAKVSSHRVEAGATPSRVWWYRRPEGPDAGSPLARVIALVALIVLVSTVVVLNQFGGEGGEAPAPEVVQVEGGEVPRVFAPADGDPFVLSMKILVRLGHALGAGEGQQGAMVAMNIDSNAVSDRQKVWAAISAAEIAGPQAGTSRLDRLEGELASRPERREMIASDIDAARALIEGRREALSKSELAAFVERNGWFGELGRALGLPRSDPSKAPLVDGGEIILIVFVMFGLTLVMVCIGALVASIMMLVSYSQGKLRRAFVAPAVGGSVWLETAAVFVFAFLMLKVVVSVLAMALTTESGEVPAWVQTSPLVLQWLVLLSIFWPLVRGMEWTE